MTRVNQIPYDEVHGQKPALICSKFAAPMTRPRLWWLNKEVDWQSHGAILSEKGDNLEVFPPPVRPPFTSFLQDEWAPADPRHNEADFAFRCLTRSVPRSGPMKDPRGIKLATHRPWKDGVQTIGRRLPTSTKPAIWSYRRLRSFADFWLSKRSDSWDSHLIILPPCCS